MARGVSVSTKAESGASRCIGGTAGCPCGWNGRTKVREVMGGQTT